jgi:hypothetical protein
MTGVCEHIRSWCEKGLAPLRGRLRPKLAKQAYSHTTHKQTRRSPIVKLVGYLYRDSEVPGSIWVWGTFWYLREFAVEPYTAPTNAGTSSITHGGSWRFESKVFESEDRKFQISDLLGSAKYTQVVGRVARTLKIKYTVETVTISHFYKEPQQETKLTGARLRRLIPFDDASVV